MIIIIKSPVKFNLLLTGKSINKIKLLSIFIYNNYYVKVYLT